MVGTGAGAYLNSATSWFSTNHDPQGTPAILGKDNTTTMTGPVLQLNAGAANSSIVAAIASTTLAKTGDYIELSLDFRTPTENGAPKGGGPLLGLYNDGGTPITRNLFYGTTTPPPAPIQDEKGYTVTKAIGETTADLRINFEAPTGNNAGTSPFYLRQNKALATTSSNRAAGPYAVYNMKIRLTQQEGGDLLITAGFGTFSTTATVPAADVATRTFNQIAFTPSSDYRGGFAYVDNVLVTTNVAQPAQ